MGQSLHTTAIEEIVRQAIDDLGSTENLVCVVMQRQVVYKSTYTSGVTSLSFDCLTIPFDMYAMKVNEKDDIYVMVDKKGVVSGCLVCEQVKLPLLHLFSSCIALYL